MTAPSFANFCVIVTGWVFAGRHTITQMLVAAGAVGTKHDSAYHRLFATARWSRDRLGLAVFDLIQAVLLGIIFPVVDDTLARKQGLKMFGTGMHHDPLLSSRGKKITNWGHSWVVLDVLVTQHAKSRRFHMVADSASGKQSVLKFLPANCDLTSRLTLKARLYATPPQRRASPAR